MPTLVTRIFPFLAALLIFQIPANAAELTVLSSGAYEHVATQLAAEFEKKTGTHITIVTDTGGGLAKRIRQGQAFDVAILPSTALSDIAKEGYTKAGTETPVATVGISVCVKAGAPKPDISSVESFRAAILKAVSVAYIDPKAGGTSGIYLEQLFARLSILKEVQQKAVLIQSGRAADLVASGQVELGIQQMSEMILVKDVTVVGELPAEIQSYTVYSAAISAKSVPLLAAQDFLTWVSSKNAWQLLAQSGMKVPQK